MSKVSPTPPAAPKKPKEEPPKQKTWVEEFHTNRKPGTVPAAAPKQGK